MFVRVCCSRRQRESAWIWCTSTRRLPAVRITPRRSICAAIPSRQNSLPRRKPALDVEELRAFEEKMYGDIWNKEDYLNWMYENLMAIKSIMSDTASIYVHLDWHIASLRQNPSRRNLRRTRTSATKSSGNAPPRTVIPTLTGLIAIPCFFTAKTANLFLIPFISLTQKNTSRSFRALIQTGANGAMAI